MSERDISGAPRTFIFLGKMRASQSDGLALNRLTRPSLMHTQNNCFPSDVLCKHFAPMTAAAWTPWTLSPNLKPQSVSPATQTPSSPEISRAPGGNFTSDLSTTAGCWPAAGWGAAPPPTAGPPACLRLFSAVASLVASALMFINWSADQTGNGYNSAATTPGGRRFGAGLILNDLKSGLL